MSLKHLILRTLAVASLGVGLAFAPAAQAQTSQGYTTIEPTQPSDTTGKVEVLEFFAYSCPYCFKLEPLTAEFSKDMPEGAVFKRVPIAFNASMADLQKLYYSLEALDRLDLHSKVFETIHNQRKPIYEFKAIADWIETEGVDRKEFEAVFNSFGVNNKVRRANDLAKNYKIEGTPTLAIGGRYITSPSIAGSYEGSIALARELLETSLKQ